MTTYTAAAAQTLYTSNPHAVFSISDTQADLLMPAYASAVGAATSITVTGTIPGTGTTPETELASIIALNANTFLSAATAAAYVSGTHAAYSISDTAANLLLSANAAAVRAAASVIVTTPVTALQLSTATVGNVAQLNHNVIYTSISDTIANLLLLTGGLSSTFITHGSNVNVTGPAATVAQLVLLHNATVSGAVTTAAISDTAANLITGIAYITSGTAVNVTTAATIAQLTALDAASESGSGYSIVHHLTYTAISDSALDLIPSGVVSSYVTNAINVTVTGSATIAQLTAIHAANGTGTVTATAIADTVERLMPSGVASTYVTSGVNVTVTDAATLAQLAALHIKTVAGSVTAHVVSDSVADLFTTGAALSAGAAIYILHGTNVIVTGTGTSSPTIAQLTAIKATNGIGTLTYAGIADTAANLAPPLGVPSIFITSGTAVTVTTTATLAQLAEIKVETTALSYTAVSDTAAKLAADAATNHGAGTYVTAGKTVTVTTAATLAQLAAIKTADATGTLIYTAMSDTAADLASTAGVLTTGATTYIKAGVNVAVTTAATLAQLAAIKAADATGTLTYTALSDTAANLATAAGVLTTAAAAYVLHGDIVTVTTAATLAQLAAINTATGGTATYTALADTAANLAPAGVASSHILHGTSVTVTTAASVAQLAAINAATGGAAIYTALADTAANLAADAATNLGHGTYVITGKAVTVTNAATIAQLTAINGATGGTATYTALSDTATALATDALSNSAHGLYVTTGKAVTVTTAASLAQLADIKAADATGTLTYTTLSDTVGDIFTTGATFSAGATAYIKAGVNVTVTGQLTIAQLAAIKTVDATGTLTYTAVSDTAANLVPTGVASLYLLHGTSVNVTTAATLAQLATINTATGGTASYTALADTAANLAADAATNSGHGTFVTTGKTVTVSNAATLSQLTAINTATGGTASYTALADTAANLAADAATNSGHGTFVVTGKAVTVTTAATVAQLTAIHTADATGTLTYTAVSDTAAILATDAATNTGHGTYVTTGKAVTATTAATLAQLAAIRAADATGTLTYTALGDTAAILATDAATNSGHGTYVTTGKTVTVSTAATIAQLAAINTATGGTATYTALSDTAANLAPAGVASAYVLSGDSVTVTTAATIAQLAAINAATGGAATYTALADTGANLAADAATNSGHGTYVVTGKAVTVTNAATVAQLTTIHTADATGTLTYTAVSDTAANLTTDALSNSAHGLYVITGKAVTVTTAATIAQLTAIHAADATGTLTYAAMSDTESNLTTNAGSYVKAGVNLTVSTSATIAQLTALHAMDNSATVTATVTATTITDTVADLLPAGVLSSYVTSGVNVVVTNTGASAPTIADLTAIANAGATASYTAVADTAANLTANVGSYVHTNVNVTVTDTASLAQLSTIHGLQTTGTVTATTVSDTVANLFNGDALSAAAVAYIHNGVNVVVTGSADIAQLTAIRAADSTGTLTYTSITDTDAHLISGGGILSGGTVSPFVTSGVHVTVLGTASIADLTALDAANAGATVSYTTPGPSVSDTVAALLANVGDYVVPGRNVYVTNTATIAQLQVIATENIGGTLTASAITDTAANLAPAGIAAPYIASGTIVTVTGTGTSAAAIAQLTALHAANGGSSLIYTDVSDTAAHLFPLASLSSYVTSSTNVNVVSGVGATAPTFAQLDAIHGTTTGALTYTSVSDTAAHFASSSGVPTTDAITWVASGTNVTVTTPATLAQLAEISTLDITGTLTYTAVTDTAAHIFSTGTTLSTAAAAYIKSGISVAVQGISTIAQLQAIAAVNTGGTLTSATIEDTAANLLITGNASFALSTDPASISLTVSDSADLTGISAASAITLFDTLHAALNGNTYTISDTAADLLAAAADPAVTGATSISLTTSDSTDLTGISAASAMTLFDTLHAALNGNTYTISDTAADLLAAAADPAVTGATSRTLSANATGLSVANAKTLFDSGLGDLSVALGGHTYTISDTAAALLAAATDPAVTGAHSITLSANATALSVASAQTLFDSSLGDLSVALGGHTYTISDTAAALLAAPTDPAVTGASSITVSAANFSTTTINSLLGDFTTIVFASGYSITDNAANLLAEHTSHPTVVAGATTITVSAATFNTSTIDSLLSAIPAIVFATGYDITDTEANLLAEYNDGGSHASVISGATTITVSGNPTLTVAQYTSLTATLHAVLSGYSLSDNAANLTTEVGSDAAAVSGATAVSVTDAANIAELTAIHALNTALTYTAVSDSVTDLFNTGTATLTAGAATYIQHDITVTVTGTGTTAASLAQLAAITTVNAPAAIIYTDVVDTAAHLENASMNGYVYAGINVTVSDATVATSDLVTIAALNTGGTLTVNTISDTAANLLAHASLELSTIHTAITLSASDATALSVANAQTLFDNVGSDLNVQTNGYTYTISDTAAALLAAATDPAVTGALSITLSTNDATPLSVANAETLFDTGLGDLNVGLNGHTYTISDTAAALLAAATDPAVTGALSITLSASATGLSVANAETLFDSGLGDLSVGLNSYSYTISDTAAALLAAATDPAVTGALSITLSANDATPLSVANAETLFDTGLGDLSVGLNGHTYTISDTAAALLAAATDPAVTGALSITLSANDATPLSVAHAQTLFDSGLGDLNVGLNGHTYTISDTAAALLAAATDPAVTGATSITLSASATGLSVANAETLFDGSLGDLSVGLNSYSYTISDTAAALLAAATDPAVTGALSITLSANDATPLSVANAETLFDTGLGDLSVGLNGHTYTISDTAAALLAAATDPAVTGALSITLSANDATPLSVANAETLFDTGLGDLSVGLNGHTYTISDTAADLLAAATDYAVMHALSITLSASDLAPLSVANAETLFDTGLGDLSVGLSGHTYTIADTAGALLAAATDPAVTGATTITLSANATGLSVANAQTLFDSALGDLSVGLGGHTYTINDTVSDLVSNLTDAAVTGAASYSFTDNVANVAGDAGVHTTGHVVTILDTAADIVSALNTGTQTANETAVQHATTIALNGLDGTALTLTGAEFSNFMAGTSMLSTADTLVLNGAPGGAYELGRDFGSSALTLGGTSNNTYIVDMGAASVSTINLDGTGHHVVNASSSVIETFVLVDAQQGGGSVITNLQANDQVNVDGGTAWIDALTGANAGNAAAVTGAGEWAFNGGTLTYWSETAGHVGAESITLVGANNNLALTLGAHNTFTVTHG